MKKATTCFYSEMTLSFPSYCFEKLSKELFQEEHGEKKTFTVIDYKRYLINYFIRLYDRDWLDLFDSHIDQNPHLLNSGKLCKRCNAEYESHVCAYYDQEIKELQINARKVIWKTPKPDRRIRDKLSIMAKHCKPFKFLYGIEDDVYQLMCWHGMVTEKTIMDKSMVGELSDGEFNLGLFSNEFDVYHHPEEFFV